MALQEGDSTVSSLAPEDDGRDAAPAELGASSSLSVVTPYSSSSRSSDYEDVQGPDGLQQRIKSKRRRAAAPRDPIMGPVYQHADVGIALGEWVDITPAEPLPVHGRVERGVLKKVLRPGTGACPRWGSLIKVKHHQLGFLQADRRIFLDTTKTYLSPGLAEPEEWVFGSGAQVAGLEAGIYTMRPGEKARFQLDWRYAFGERGVSPGPPYVPPHADIFLDVTMIAWTLCDKERSSMSSAELLEEARRVKEDANAKFAAGKWAEANFIYDDVFAVIKLMYHEFVQTEWNAVRALEAQALNNQAMCYLRMGDYDMAERRARACLDIEQSNIKALYRLGVALNERSKHEQARTMLKYAVCLKPDCLTIRDEYNRACRGLRDERIASTKTWKGAFGRRDAAKAATKQAASAPAAVTPTGSVQPAGVQSDAVRAQRKKLEEAFHLSVVGDAQLPLAVSSSLDPDDELRQYRDGGSRATTLSPADRARRL